MSVNKVATALADEPDIELAIVFGSVARQRARFDSDVDVAVKASKPLDAADTIRLIDKIAQATGRPVDLVDLRRVGEPLLGQILRHGKRILGSDGDYAELALRHIYANEDFVPYLKRLLKERSQAWIG